MRDKFWKIWDKHISSCAQKVIFGIGMGLGLFACAIVLLSQYIPCFKAGAIWTGSIGFLLSTIALYLSARSHQRQEILLTQNKSLLETECEKTKKILEILENGVFRVVSVDGKATMGAASSRLVSIVLYAMKKAFQKPNKNIDYTLILPEYTEAIRIVILNIFAAFPDMIIEGHIGADNAIVVTKFDKILQPTLDKRLLLSKFQHDDKEHLVYTALENIGNMLKN